MKSWLDAHPVASYEEQVAAARQIWDSIDNRFGEMVDDNIFWNQTLKQVAKLGMRSYSWNLGTIREIGGGVKDIASREWSPRAAYVVAMPMWVGTVNAVYQYLKTGKSPESVQDLIGGQTGGESTLTIPAAKFGQRSSHSTQPERVAVPGYQKDVMGWYEDWQSQVKNKVATLPRMAWDLAWNADWKGDPIFDPESAAPQWMKQFFAYASENLQPISVKQLRQGEKEGSAITAPEAVLGLRPAAPYVSDPEGYRRQQANLNKQRQSRKTRGERKRESQYGGTAE